VGDGSGRQVNRKGNTLLRANSYNYFTKKAMDIRSRKKRKKKKRKRSIQRGPCVQRPHVTGIVTTENARLSRKAYREIITTLGKQQNKLKHPRETSPNILPDRKHIGLRK